MEYSDMWRASLGGDGGAALVPPQDVLDAQYEQSFMFANNGPGTFRGFNGRTVRAGTWPRQPPLASAPLPAARCPLPSAVAGGPITIRLTNVCSPARRLRRVAQV